MDKAFTEKMKLSLVNMRAKVVNAKGEGVKGLTPLPTQKDKKMISPAKTREANS